MALHALQFGNVRAVAMLWQRVVREFRFAHWDRGVPLPRMDTGTRCTSSGGGGSGGNNRSVGVVTGEVEGWGTRTEGGISRVSVASTSITGVVAAGEERTETAEEEVVPDILACLLHQKLQLLNVCINRRKAASVAAFEASSVAHVGPTPLAGTVSSAAAAAAMDVTGTWDDAGDGWGGDDGWGDAGGGAGGGDGWGAGADVDLDLDLASLLGNLQTPPLLGNPTTLNPKSQDLSSEPWVLNSEP